MFIDFLLTVFEECRSQDAIIWRDRGFSYQWLRDRVQHWRSVLQEQAIGSGTIVALEADFSPNSVALFLALVERGCVLVPLTSSVEAKKPEFCAIAQVEVRITVDQEDQVTVTRGETQAQHELYAVLRQRQHPGLVLFSSGSTGKSKATVHDFTGLLEKFKVRRQALRTVTFLLYDHIGGVNTMLYVLANGGCIITVAERSPEAVLDAIARHRVELLPTSPSFLNLLLLSEAWQGRDLSSLQTVSYGTEPMPQSTLQRFHALFPTVKLQQTYGLSEVGILRSKSKSPDSLWVKIGGEGFETRIVDGMLQIHAQSAMLGYLNAPSPFTEDGWFITGDAVEVDGEYLRILGRKSELINVGGEKVYPQEVEDVLMQVENVAEATVYGEKNPIMGNIVCARLRLRQPEPLLAVKRRVTTFCQGKLDPFKIPVRIVISDEAQFGGRFKKKRSPHQA